MLAHINKLTIIDLLNNIKVEYDVLIQISLRIYKTVNGQIIELLEKIGCYD